MEEILMELKQIGTVVSDIKDFTKVRHLTRGWTEDTVKIHY